MYFDKPGASAHKPMSPFQRAMRSPETSPRSKKRKNQLGAFWKTDSSKDAIWESVPRSLSEGCRSGDRSFNLSQTPRPAMTRDGPPPPLPVRSARRSVQSPLPKIPESHQTVRLPALGMKAASSRSMAEPIWAEATTANHLDITPPPLPQRPSIRPVTPALNDKTLDTNPFSRPRSHSALPPSAPSTSNNQCVQVDLAGKGRSLSAPNPSVGDAPSVDSLQPDDDDRYVSQSTHHAHEQPIRNAQQRLPYLQSLAASQMADSEESDFEDVPSGLLPPSGVNKRLSGKHNDAGGGQNADQRGTGLLPSGLATRDPYSTPPLPMKTKIVVREGKNSPVLARRRVKLACASRPTTPSPPPPPVPPRNYSPPLEDSGKDPPPVRGRSSSNRSPGEQVGSLEGTQKGMNATSVAQKPPGGSADEWTPVGELTLPLGDRCWEFKPGAESERNDDFGWMRLDKSAMAELNIAVQWRHIEVSFVTHGTMYTANLPKMAVKIGGSCTDYLLRCVNDTVGSGAWYKGDPEGDVRAESLERCLELEERLLVVIEKESAEQQHFSLMRTQEELGEHNLYRVPPLRKNGLRVPQNNQLRCLLNDVREATKAQNDINICSANSAGACIDSRRRNANAICALLEPAKSRRWSCKIDGQLQELAAGGCEVLNIAIQRRSLGIALVSGGYKKHFDLPHMTMLFEDKCRAELLCTGDVVGTGAWYVERNGSVSTVDASTCALLDHSVCLGTALVKHCQQGHHFTFQLDKMQAIDSDTNTEYILLRAPTVDCLNSSLDKTPRKDPAPPIDSAIVPPVSDAQAKRPIGLLPNGEASNRPPLPPLLSASEEVRENGEERLQTTSAKENHYSGLPCSYDPTKSMAGKVDVEKQLAASGHPTNGKLDFSSAKFRTLNRYHSNERLKHLGKKRWLKLVGDDWTPLNQHESTVLNEAFVRRQSEAHFWTKCPIRGQVLYRIDLPRMQLRENANSSTFTLLRCEEDDQYGCGVWYFKTPAGFYLALSVQVCESLDAAITPSMVSHRVALCIDKAPHEFDLFQMSMLDTGTSTCYELRRTPPLSTRQRYDVASAATSSMMPSAEPSSAGPGPGPWEGQGITYPPAWEQQQEDIELKTVPVGSSEYKKVASAVQYTLPTADVTQVQRVQHVWQWERYWRERGRVLRRSGCTGERLLFHGTRSTPVERICHSEDGLDMRFSAKGMWGQGNYFAVDASYSHHYASKLSGGSRLIFLCLVLTGIAAEIPPDDRLRRPPVRVPSGPGQPVELLYDSVTGVTRRSIIYVTYANDKAYPLYLIRYTVAS